MLSHTHHHDSLVAKRKLVGRRHAAICCGKSTAKTTPWMKHMHIAILKLASANRKLSNGSLHCRALAKACGAYSPVAVREVWREQIHQLRDPNLRQPNSRKQNSHFSNTLSSKCRNFAVFPLCVYVVSSQPLRGPPFDFYTTAFFSLQINIPFPRPLTKSKNLRAYSAPSKGCQACSSAQEAANATPPATVRTKMPRPQDRPLKVADGRDCQRSVVSAFTTRCRASDWDHLSNTSRLPTRNRLIGRLGCFYQLSLPTTATPTLASAKLSVVRSGSTLH
jgi:hypothetical protein